MTRTHTALFAAILLLTSSSYAQENEYAALVARAAKLERSGHYEEAADVHRQTIALVERQKLGDWALALALNSLAMVQDELGRQGEAVHLYRRSMALLEKVKGKSSPDYATVQGNLAADLGLMGQTALAEEMLRESITIFSTHQARNEVRAAISESILGGISLILGRKQEAEKHLTHAIAVFERIPGNDIQLPTALNNLGVIRRDQKRHTEAVAIFRRSIDIVNREFGPDHPKLLQPLNNLALTQYDAGRYKEALGTMEQAIRIAESHLRTGDAGYGSILLNYAAMLRKTGNKDAARQFEQRGKSMVLEAERSNGVGLTVDASSFRRR